MDFRERFEAYEREVHEELRHLAQPHVEASPLFALLDTNTREFPAQSLATRQIDGNPQSTGTVEFVAQGIEPRFSAFTDALDAQEESHGEISRLGELLRDNQNIILVTNHGDLKDIAYTLAAYYITLKERGYEFHSSLVMSKILSFIGVDLGNKVDPATNVLKLICDEQFFSFPRTKTIEESRIASQVVDSYNRSVRKKMVRRLSKGRNLFAIAASGTTDKPLKDDPNTISMGPIGAGTAKLMMVPNSLVVPIAVWITPEQVLFQPCDIPRKVTNFEEADDVMSTIANFLSKNVEGKNFIYQADTTAKNLGRLAIEE
jgi:hypothetical protein